MKKLIALIVTLTMTLTAFSQKDTSNKEAVKCLPISVIRLVIKDLIRGDEYKSQLKLSDSLVVELSKKVSYKDSVIVSMGEKEKGFKDVITAQNEKYGVLDNYTKKIETDLKIEKVKNKFKSIISGGAIIVLSILLILK